MTTPDWVNNRSLGRTPKYPFRTMEIGTTFDIPVGSDQPRLSSVRVYCHQRGRELGKKFLCHQYPDGLIQVFRQA